MNIKDDIVVKNICELVLAGSYDKAYEYAMSHDCKELEQSNNLTCFKSLLACTQYCISSYTPKFLWGVDFEPKVALNNFSKVVKILDDYQEKLEHIRIFSKQVMQKLEKSN